MASSSNGKSAVSRGGVSKKQQSAMVFGAGSRIKSGMTGSSSVAVENCKNLSGLQFGEASDQPFGAEAIEFDLDAGVLTLPFIIQNGAFAEFFMGHALADI